MRFLGISLDNFDLPWVVEVENPGSYLDVHENSISVTSDQYRCTRFPSLDEALKAIQRYYGDRKPSTPPQIIQPDWLKSSNSLID